MVVGYRLSILQVFFLACALGCSNGNIVKDIAGKSFLIAGKYKEDTALAYIVNRPILSNESQDITVSRATNVQLYYVGEMDINLTGVDRSALFKSDDVTLFFDEKQTGLKKPIEVSWLDGSEKDNKLSFVRDGILYRSVYDNVRHQYTWLITIPWKKLSIETNKMPEFLKFDIAIGDNDDGMKQKSKISWKKRSASIPNPTGRIYLGGAPNSNPPDALSGPRTLSEEPSADEWHSLPQFPIAQLMAGKLFPKDDLSASFQTCWDPNNVYFKVSITDSRKDFVDLNSIRQANTFHDISWIEDSLGKVVWKSNAFFSKHAGGAVKNQMIDTVINLKAGRYKIRYISDESHGWDSWDDKPPLTGFTGLIIYKKR